MVAKAAQAPKLRHPIKRTNLTSFSCQWLESACRAGSTDQVRTGSNARCLQSRPASPFETGWPGWVGHYDQSVLLGLEDGIARPRVISMTISSRSWPRGSSERNQRRQTAASLRSLSRNKDWLDAHTFFSFGNIIAINATDFEIRTWAKVSNVPPLDVVGCNGRDPPTDCPWRGLSYDNECDKTNTTRLPNIMKMQRRHTAPPLNTTAGAIMPRAKNMLRVPSSLSDR